MAVERKIIGLGVDIVEVERVGKDVEETPGFAEEFCSPKEIAFCDQFKGDERRSRYARHFSLKEAVIKALGGGGETGKEPELDWREIIIREDDPDSVLISLMGKAKERADKLGINSISPTFIEVKGLPIVICIASANNL